MINTTIGKYKIIRLIGEGGMASVYEAEHEMLGTKVAIKVLNPILSANAQIKERFRNEAKLMASLDHPNITKVIDFDEQPQQLSIVMEYLNGEDLNQKIKRNGPLSEKEITDVFSQTLYAFQYAHEKGIVHRDIKPSNIFILPHGHVKILDFGIAKLFGQGNEMTQTGTQMGTPIYMSPEQVKADKSIDHRSDIYSLGVTLFFAINGKPPYNSDTDSQFDIFTKIVYEELPEFLIPSKFKDMVLKACNKNREHRFQSCKEYLTEFKSLAINNPYSNDNTIIDKIETVKTKSDNLRGENDGGVEIEKTNILLQEKQKTSNVNHKNKWAIISVLVSLCLLVILFNKINKSDTSVETNLNENNGDKPQSEATQSYDKLNLIDQNGNEFDTVQVGFQTWSCNNLNVDKFRNGDPIPHAKSENEWVMAARNKQPAWCYFDNDPGNGNVHGKLYNWYAVNDTRGLAPKDWRVPNDDDWHQFVNSFGGFPVYAKKIRNSNKKWNVLLSGVRTDETWGEGGVFAYGIGNHGGWWTSDNYSQSEGIMFDLNYIEVAENTHRVSKGAGYSVRCLKD